MKKGLYILLCICLLAALATGCSEGYKANVNGIDVDISEMTNLLAYSQVVHILDTPADYIGKTLKIRGQYFSSYFEQTGLYHHFVVVGDEELCCQMGMEFVLKGKNSYPEDYPVQDAEIEVVGIFESYDLSGSTLYRMAINDIMVLETEGLEKAAIEG